MIDRWRRLFRLDGDPRREVDDELRFHIEARIDDLVAAGMSRDAARTEAGREFGDMTGIADACVTIDLRRRRRRTVMDRMHAVWQDVTFAGRALRRSPSFTVAATACVALGIGMTTTIFSAVHAILIRPLPYPDADRLVAIYSQSVDRTATHVNISIADYFSWRAENRTFATLGMWTWTSHTLADETGAERVEGASVTADLLPLLGVQPLIGRTFRPEEEKDGGPHVVILGHGLWQRRFGGADLLGRAITIDGTPHTVVGIMPPRFGFPDRGQLWVPFITDPMLEPHGNRVYAGAIGRLRPGVTIGEARTDFDAISARLTAEFPRDNGRWIAQLIPIREDLTGDLARPLLVMLGAGGFVLLIACANVANLMLARGTTRHRELAIRIALGAGRGRLARQVLAESAVIAVTGGAVGAVLAVAGVAALRLLLPAEMPFYIALDLDRAVLLFAVGLSAVTALIVALVPAWRAGDADAGSALRESAAQAGGGVRRSRVRSTLIVGEVAVALVLMAGAMLLIRSYRSISGTDLGFDEKGILSLRVSLPFAGHPQRATRLGFYDALMDRIRAMPGVQLVGSAQGIPFSGWNVESRMSVAGRPAPSGSAEPVAHYQWVTADYFAAIGVPLRAGRPLTAADRDSLAPVGLVNEELVRRWFPGEDPIGKRIRPGGASSDDPWVTVVGVVADFRHYRLPEPMPPAIYFPYASLPLLSQTLVVRTSLADPLTLVPSIRAAIRELDPTIAAYQVQTLDQVVSRSLWRQRFQGEVLGAFAAMALLLTAVGIYGVVSYGVAQRTRELGVRIALGASRGNVLALVLGQGARLALAGVAIGLVAALLLTRVVASLLHGIQPVDPVTFIAVPSALLVVTIAACWVPARRATRVHPLVAMRAD